MKNNVFSLLNPFLLFILVFSLNANAQTWSPRSSGLPKSPLAQNFTSVTTPDATTAFACGSRGTIIKSSDSGATWVKQNSGITSDLKCIFFPTKNVGFAVSDNGDIINTNDGGVKWSTQLPATFIRNEFQEQDDEGNLLFNDDGSPKIVFESYPENRFNNVYFTSATTGYVVGSNRNILKTDNGGNTWVNKSPSSSVSEFLSVYFISDTVGYVLGNDSDLNGVIFKTTDGGNTWIEVKTNIPESLFNVNKIYFTTELIGFGAGAGGIIVKTTDGGVTWSTQSSSTTSTLLDVNFVSKTNGWASGIDGIILSTKNGGDSWKKEVLEKHPTIEAFNLKIRGISFFDTNFGVAVGNEEAIFIYKKSTATLSIISFDNTPLFKLYPNPSTGILNIETKNPVNYDLYDVLGKKISTFKFKANETQIINLENLKDGIYFLKNDTDCKKIILKR